jgi:hypothetical protein
MTRDLDVLFMTYDSRGNVHPKKPQAGIVATQTYLITTTNNWGINDGTGLTFEISIEGLFL